MQIQQLDPTMPRQRRQIEQLLTANGLRYDDMDYYVAIADEPSGELVGGGGLHGGIIKCIAVDDAHRGEAVANTIVSHLIAVAAQRGHHCVRLFTKPRNMRLFESLSFRLLAEAPEAILMETGIGGIEAVKRELESEKGKVKSEKSNSHTNSHPNISSPHHPLTHSPHHPPTSTPTHPLTGCIVMNCNPFTLGHLYLIEQAAQQVDRLFVMVVRADCSMFGYDERLDMARKATAHVGNVAVIAGNDYTVSATTFPTYFLKRIDDATDTQMTLDIDLYRRHIAPALGATVRFVGSEPTDTLTHRYNDMMRSMLGDVRQVTRLEKDGLPVSASLVRRAMTNNDYHRAAALVPATTLPYLMAHLATRALKAELNTTPKPGLVDSHDNGAHQDMDHALMSASIRALHPYLARLALMGYDRTLPTAHDVQQVGIEAEESMLRATDGVNTHRGALFAIGLAVVAVAHAIYRQANGMAPAPGDIATEARRHIMAMATQMAATRGTHGDKACRKTQGRTPLKGALDNAREGYATLFDDWLPFYDSHIRMGDTHVMHRTLLRIMASLDDTNIVYRTDLDTLRTVQRESAEVLADFSIDALEAMNASFVQRNISPGGSADMLSLVVFLHAFRRKP